jgi:hypothetical protein
MSNEKSHGVCRSKVIPTVVALAALAVAEMASAEVVTLSLSDFVIFSGGSLTVDGGYETEIGGHTTITGNIGSNQDLFLQGNPLPGYPAQLNGSAYAGGNLTFGQDLTVGSSTQSYQVVANGDASIGGNAKIWGTLDATSATLGTGASVTGGVTAPSSTTFGAVSMWGATSFTAGGADQEVDSGLDQLTLGAGTYGALSTSQQNQTVTLSDAGNYYFNSMTAQGGFKLEVDLTNGPVNIYVVGDVNFGAQNIQLMVKGAGTGGAFVPIDQAQSLAGDIYLETKGTFTMGGNGAWGGTVYSTLADGVGVNLGQYADWTGAAYALDSFDAADHGTWNYVPLAAVPVPAAVWLFGSGLLGLVGIARRKKAA